VAWLYLAPTQIGGSTSYITTHGISMLPRFHTGDLAIVRPADHYEVGEIVAYHSTLLHIVVLHRIIARDGDRYVFKGDNNNFIDPTHPDRAQLVGALWLHVPRGGLALAWLHTPLIAGALTAIIALLLLFVGAGEKRRRRNHRRNGATGSARQGPLPVHTSDHGTSHRHNTRALLIASAVAVVAFVGLSLIAFTHPLQKAATVNTPYTQQVRFGDRTSAPAGPVYPTGVVNTGDPIFLQLVHRVHVQIDYSLATVAAHRITGTEVVLLRLTGPGGWSRSIQLIAPRRFTGDHVSTQVTLDLPYLQSLIGRVAALTGFPAAAGYTVSVDPQVQISGTVAGKPIKASFDPVLSFQVDALQLLPGSGSTTSGTPQGGFTPSQRGTVATVSTAPNTLSVDGHALAISTLRWVALVDFLLAAATALVLAVRLKLSAPFGETARIQADYGHLIVPIGAPADDLWTPFDVPSIRALVRLAECSERLILHHHDDSADTYIVDDEGTMYRYKAEANGVVWGEWSSTAPDVSVNGHAPDPSSTSSPGDAAELERDLPVRHAPVEPDPPEPDAPLLPDAGGHSLRGFDANGSPAVRASVRSISALRARYAKALGSRRRPPPGNSPPRTVSPDTFSNSAEMTPENLT
jgi:signal peptidase I